MSKARFYVNPDGHGEPTVWRVGGDYPDHDTAVLRQSEVPDAELWALIERAMNG